MKQARSRRELLARSPAVSLMPTRRQHGVSPGIGVAPAAGRMPVLRFGFGSAADNAARPGFVRLLVATLVGVSLPPECNYAKDRYSAPHCLRWLDGWFYNFYLEGNHR